MITATNFATRIRRENYIYTLSHCRQNRARKGGHQKTYYPPSQKVIGNREVDSMYVCMQQRIHVIVLVVVLQSNFYLQWIQPLE